MKAPHSALFALYRVLAHGGFSEAHRATGIATTTLSSGVTRAEAEYGCKFCVRKPFAITRCGRVMLPTLEAFVKQMEITERRLEQMAHPELRLAAPEVVINTYLTGILMEFEQR